MNLRYAVLLLILFSLTGLLFGAAPQGPRAKYNFNPGWKLFVGDPAGAETTGFDDSGWKNISLPRAWNEDDAFRKDIKDLSTGIAWYRKHFTMPVSSTGKKIFLEFEGIRQAGEFYLNGKFIGRHENGVTAFGFDITGAVIPGENVFAARIDNSWDYKEKATGSAFQWNDRNFYANYGGINKNVYLHITGRLYQTLPLYTNLKTIGPYVYATGLNVLYRTAKITAETEVRNETDASKTFSYEVVINDMDGETLKKINGGNYTLAPGETRIVSAAARLSRLKFWSWGYGYLYDVYTVLKVDGKIVDSVKSRTGFRKTEFANGLFKLNDRTLQLKGYAQRTTNEWPALGSAVPPWMSDYTNRRMVEGNADLVRWMHVTPWKQDVESCDRMGLMQAMPAGDSEKDVDGRRWEHRVEAMRDAIIYNRNNPSVIFYESGNKGISEAHMAEMKAVRDKYDPHGGRAAGSREMLNSKVSEYGGEMLYINKSARQPVWAMEYSRDEGLRKYWDEYSPPFHKEGEGPRHNGAEASAYNHNQDAHAIENVLRWYDYWEARPGTGKRVSSGGVNIIFSDSNTHHRGAENYRRSGEVDAMRIPKDGFYANRVMWEGWVDIEKSLTHIIGHWNYAPGTKKNIYVVSGADKVELFVNGKSKGFGEQSSRFLFTFPNIEWQPGEIKAVGYSAENKKVSEDEKETAGEPYALRLMQYTGPGGLRANGADVAIVAVEVVDKAGKRCPTALDMVDFTMSGEAEWRGGIAQGPDNYILSKRLPVEGGVNRVLVRSTPTAGKVVVSAAAEGLRPARIEFDSTPFVTEGNMSVQMPDDGAGANLSSGTTMAAESFKAARSVRDIARVTAGSNAEKAAMSFDDDETTDWSSDGQAATGWVRYDLKKAAKINQVVLKLVGWRTQSYPVRISVDDKVVFSGNTSRSLGYVTFTFPGVVGKSVRIELAGEAGNRDEFGKIIEITGIPDPQSAANKGGAKILGIVEAEIYGPLD